MFYVASRGPFYFVHDDNSFEPYGGMLTERRDAERIAQLMRLVSGSRDSIYAARETIANLIAGLRWDIREHSGHQETRTRAWSLRWVADHAQDRLESVTRP